MNINFSEMDYGEEIQITVKRSLYPRLRKLGISAKLKNKTLTGMETEVSELLKNHKKVPPETRDTINLLFTEARKRERELLEQLKSNWLECPSFSLKAQAGCGFDEYEDELTKFEEEHNDVLIAYLQESGYFDEDDEYGEGEKDEAICKLAEAVEMFSQILPSLVDAMSLISQKLDTLLALQSNDKQKH